MGGWGTNALGGLRRLGFYGLEWGFTVRVCLSSVQGSGLGYKEEISPEKWYAMMPSNSIPFWFVVFVEFVCRYLRSR